MKYSHIIKEGIERNDLDSLILPKLSIGEFEPKTGNTNEVLVLGFYLKDESPAQDLARFIEKSVIDVLDTEVSPNPDDSGLYMVFVEINNDSDSMKNTLGIINDISNLSSVETWNFEFFEGNNKKVNLKQIKAWLTKKT